MTEANEIVLVEETPGLWQSLQSSITALMRALDYDPQEHAAVSLHKLGKTVSQLEARLALLEQHDEGRAES
jgi:hypothetical protein